MNRIQSQFHPKPVQPGTFLVASPSLTGTPFSRTVVFLLQANREGTFGAVINRPAGDDLVSEWSSSTGLEIARQSLIQGGPIGGPVVALHQNKPLADVEICAGMCLSVDKDVLQRLARESNSPYRIVLGIAGWEQQQLSNEINSGHWFPMEVDPAHVFDDHTAMWESFVREFGRQSLSRLIGEDQFPVDPTLN
jgi:putative transcriptional regulator